MEQIFWEKCKHIVFSSRNCIRNILLLTFSKTKATSFFNNVGLIHFNKSILNFLYTIIWIQRNSRFLIRRDQFLRKRCIIKNLIIIISFYFKTCFFIILACNNSFNRIFHWTISFRITWWFILHSYLIYFVAIVI